jgi:2-polyprenyl-3-methyl-5-hydroxy-6-metoxy-1,4-benzoquinol methylase
MTQPKFSERNGHELIFVACPLCGRDSSRILYQPWNESVETTEVLSASGGVRGTQTIVKCLHCSLIYVNPRLRPDVVVDSYAGAEDEIYVGAASGREQTFRRCVALIETYSAKGKILDVGCAAGFFVKAAADAGWDAMGVEPCRWLAEYGIKKLDAKIIPATLAEANFPDATFDVVTMWDVLEHVPDPIADLQEVFRILRPGGLLVVNYPDAGTWQAKLAGRHWWFFLSVHLTYFTQNTIKAMVQKAGFVDCITRPHYQSLELSHLMKMGELYSKSISSIGAKACEVLRIGNWRIPYYASQTNLMCRKPPA